MKVCVKKLAIWTTNKKTLIYSYNNVSVEREVHFQKEVEMGCAPSWHFKQSDLNNGNLANHCCIMTPYLGANLPIIAVI